MTVLFKAQEHQLDRIWSPKMNSCPE